MKTIALKLDDFVLELLTREAKQRKMTRMEIIRSAIVNFLVTQDDAEDLAYIQTHKKDRKISFAEVFGDAT